MKWPSINLLIGGVLLAIAVHTLFRISMLFVLPSCVEGQDCAVSSLSTKPKLELQIFNLAISIPEAGFVPVYYEEVFNYSKARQIQVMLPIDEETRENGTMRLWVKVGSPRVVKYPGTYYETIQEPVSQGMLMEMTHYKVPEIVPFNLLSYEKNSGESEEHLNEPVTHLKTQVTLMMMTDDVKIPAHNFPPELARNVDIAANGMFQPILHHSFIKNWYKDSVKISPQDEFINVTIHYTPISIEKLRLVMTTERRRGPKALGFSFQETDEILGILLDTDPYLLGGIILIFATQILLDYSTFNYDVDFWRSDFSKISVQMILRRLFYRVVTFLYFLNERCSMLILLPTAIQLVDLLWRSRKKLWAELVGDDRDWLKRIEFLKNDSNTKELETPRYEVYVKHMSHLLYPLVVGAAAYSLLYQSHKSWYSWGINSFVNAVYAFDFMFMLRQSFINYEFKTVPYWPWRVKICLALDAVVDDIHAFILPFPSAQRVACFRNDVVLLVEIYQGCLYPVDMSDEYDPVAATDETRPTSHESHDGAEN